MLCLTAILTNSKLNMWYTEIDILKFPLFESNPTITLYPATIQLLELPKMFFYDVKLLRNQKARLGWKSYVLRYYVIYSVTSTCLFQIWNFTCICKVYLFIHSFIQSFRNQSYYRPVISSKAASRQIAIFFVSFQISVSSLFFQLIQ